MTRTPLAAAAALVSACAIALIPQQAAANGCLQPPAWDQATNTYTITTANELHDLGQRWANCTRDATVRLANDIDLTGTGEFTPIGDSGAPFMGTFDGGGHRITGLQVTSPTGNDFGLFGNAQFAVIRNVSVTGTVLGPGQFGGGILVGSTIATTISGVSVNGTVRALTGAGGMVGIMAAGSLSDSSAAVVVSADAGSAGGAVGAALVTRDGSARITRVRSDGSVTADLQYAGGIVGSLAGSTVSLSSSTAWARGRFAGGLVGYADADGADTAITDSFSTGQVMGAPAGAEAVGGIVGATCTARPTSLIRNYFAGTLQPAGAPSGGIAAPASLCTSSIGAAAAIEGNVWNSDTAGAAGAGSGVGAARTTAQMKQLATYTALGWSMANGWEAAGSSTWGICPQVNDGYPFLQGQASSAACAAPPATPNAIPPLLEATVLPSRSRVTSGQALRIGIRARNTGGYEATSVVSCVRLPAGLVLVRAPGAVRSGRLACFPMGTVAAKGQATRVVTARAATATRRSVIVTGTTKASGLSRVNATPVTVTVVPRAARARVTG